MPSDQQTSAWLIVEMRGDATSIRLRSSPPSSPKARGIADCADLAIVPTFRLDCRRGKGFVVP